jgi:hypothetical protein
MAKRKPRIVSWFSCGAASAYATYLAHKKYPKITVAYCRVLEEHPDSLRFLQEYSHRTGIHITILENAKYHGSVREVLRRNNYIKGPKGAICTRILKKEVRQSFQRPNDIHVFGYTSEEENRANLFWDANNEMATDFILLERKITKKECLQFVKEELKIELPMMYRLGYFNNNCIGCVKGGMGYWNKIRHDFPDVFNWMTQEERKRGFALNKDKNGLVFLDELDPHRGNHKEDAPGECGFSCEYRGYYGKEDS